MGVFLLGWEVYQRRCDYQTGVTASARVEDRKPTQTRANRHLPCPQTHSKGQWVHFTALEEATAHAPSSDCQAREPFTTMTPVQSLCLYSSSYYCTFCSCI